MTIGLAIFLCLYAAFWTATVLVVGISMGWRMKSGYPPIANPMPTYVVRGKAEEKKKADPPKQETF